MKKMKTHRMRQIKFSQSDKIFRNIYIMSDTEEQDYKTKRLETLKFNEITESIKLNLHILVQTHFLIRNSNAINYEILMLGQYFFNAQLWRCCFMF